MKIVLLDRITLGEDLDISGAEKFGTVVSYEKTEDCDVADRIADADVIFVNKTKLNRENLKDAKQLKIICEAATGFDNIDVNYCGEAGIAVCNVPGYSVYSVAQLTVSIVLNLVNHLKEFTQFTADGSYTQSGNANKLSPVFHELLGKTWGIVGYGSIGTRVGAVAEALGCRILAYKRTPVEGVTCTDLDTIMTQSDIITVHIPLSNGTRGIISKEQIGKMKESAILVNTARGAVVDEQALCEAIKNKKIAGIGSDVYSTEPFGTDSPYYEIKDYDNVCLTPHMAWGTIEARERCFNEMLLNLQSYLDGENRNRVDIKN